MVRTMGRWPAKSTLPLFLILLSTSSSRAPESPDWSALPASVRPLVILSRDKVPAYPKASVLQVRRWPKTRTFDGKLYSLEYGASKFDMLMPPTTDFAKIPTGWSYSASYVRHSGKPERTSRRGPSYYWRSDSTLSERAYSTSSLVQIWQYDSAGALTGYHYRRRAGGGCESRHRKIWADEYFGRDGELIGLLANGEAYWMGRETSTDGMFLRLRAYRGQERPRPSDRRKGLPVHE